MAKWCWLLARGISYSSHEPLHRDAWVFSQHGSCFPPRPVSALNTGVEFFSSTLPLDTTSLCLFPGHNRLCCTSSSSVTLTFWRKWSQEGSKALCLPPSPGYSWQWNQLSEVCIPFSPDADPGSSVAKGNRVHENAGWNGAPSQAPYITLRKSLGVFCPASLGKSGASNAGERLCSLFRSPTTVEQISTGHLSSTFSVLDMLCSHSPFFFRTLLWA